MSSECNHVTWIHEMYNFISFPLGLCTDVGAVKAKIILSGDPMQLEAVTKSSFAMKWGYRKSFMQFLMEKPLYDITESSSSHIVQLIKNYRSHVDILAPSNDLFYRNTLIAAASPSK